VETTRVLAPLGQRYFTVIYCCLRCPHKSKRRQRLVILFAAMPVMLWDLVGSRSDRII